MIASTNINRVSESTARTYNLGAPPSWEAMRDMLVMFKRMMRLKYRDGFTCEQCNGDVLIFDGVSFGPAKQNSSADPTRSSGPVVEAGGKYVVTQIHYVTDNA